MNELLALYSELSHISTGSCTIGVDGLLNEFKPPMNEPVIKGIDERGRRFFRMALTTVNGNDGRRYGILTIHQKEPTETSPWIVVNNKGLLSYYFNEENMTVNFIKVVKDLLTTGITTITRKKGNDVVVATGLRVEKDSTKATATAIH